MKLKSIFSITILSLSTSIYAQENLSASSSRIAPQVKAAHAKNQNIDIMIRLKPNGNFSSLPLILNREQKIRQVRQLLIESAEISQRELLQLLKRSHTPYQSFYIDNVVRVPAATASLVQAISQLNSVQKIDLNYRGTLKLPKAPQGRAALDEDGIAPNIKEIFADRAWKERGAKGRGLVIGGADSGIDFTHPVLRKKYRGYKGFNTSHDYNWHDAIHESKGRCPANSPAPCDDTDHGSHTMGTMVGSDGEKNQIGVAPEAQWIGCRNMTAGSGTLATYLECFEFFMAPYPRGGQSRRDGRPELAPHIINNSWSCPADEGCKPDDLIGAVRALRAAGIFVVAAAGNDGSACGSLQDPPGTYSGDLVAVGAYNRYMNDIAYFSSRGPSGFSGKVGIDVVAPGVGILSSTPGNSFAEMDGTSMAAPHVAGAVALLWSYRPELIGQIEQTTELLARTARPLTSSENCGPFPGSQTPNAVFGSGMLDAFALLQ